MHSVSYSVSVINYIVVQEKPCGLPRSCFVVDVGPNKQLNNEVPEGFSRGVWSLLWYQQVTSSALEEFYFRGQ